VAEWMKKQGRFKHLFKPGNEHLLEASQAYVDSEWQKLLKLEAMTAK
jgi:pyruvate ferredoxin oxidoreductase beta subunit